MSDACCEVGAPHLVIVGGGSAAFAAALEASAGHAEVTLINDGLPIGGTCVNVGCVPSKTLIRAAEALHRGRHQPFAGIAVHGDVTDFAALVMQKRELVESLRQAKYLDVIAGHENVRVVSGRARFVAPLAVEVEVKGEGTVGGTVGRTVGRTVERIRGSHFLIATGTRPFAPPVAGLATSGYLTNQSAFELEALPRSLIVLGARYIGLEIAQMFARFGTAVTVLQRSSRILPTESERLTHALTGYLEDEGIDIVTGVDLERVERDGSGVVVNATVRGVARTFRAEHVLAATGRAPNTAGLGLQEVGVAVDSRGFVAVDDALRTSAPRVFAAGDVIGDPSFVYTAAYEGALAAANALAGESRSRDYTALPWVVFTDPQIAGVGMDLDAAKARGIDAESSVLPLAHVPRCIAARDTRGFIELVRERQSDHLVGARVLAPEGSELLMEASLAVRHQIPVAQLAAAFHPYLTLAEGVKLAAISFSKDVASLSCCAI